MKAGETILAPSGWKAVVSGSRGPTGTVEIEWVSGPLSGRPARISAAGCKVVPAIKEKRARRKHRGRIVRRDGKVIG